MHKPKNTLCYLFLFSQQKAVPGVLPIIYSLYVHGCVSHMTPARNPFVLEDAETPAAGGIFPVGLNSHIKEANKQLCLSSRQVANLACANKLRERRLQITSHVPLPPSKTSSVWGSLLQRAQQPGEASCKNSNRGAGYGCYGQSTGSAACRAGRDCGKHHASP